MTHQSLEDLCKITDDDEVTRHLKQLGVQEWKTHFARPENLNKCVAAHHQTRSVPLPRDVY